jgi:hypothetical protein
MELGEGQCLFADTESYLVLDEKSKLVNSLLDYAALGVAT